jgi:cyanophycinase
LAGTSRHNRAAAVAGRLLQALVLAAGLPFAVATWPGGKLLVAGGALSADNGAVYRAFIDALPPEGQVVILPVASARPARAAEDFKRTLVLHGLREERIEIFPLAIRDDSATADIDESRWSENAWDVERVARLGTPAAFWLSGGDQTRITRSLRRDGRDESPLLELMRRRLGEGAVIGGTSAGAAVMSQPMIAGGNGFQALLEPPVRSGAESEGQDSGRLFLADGLGFLPGKIIDQHFDRKARLGRLVRALGATGVARGIGIDENTALLVDLAGGKARVLGVGSVTLLDAGMAQFDFSGDILASGLQIGVLVEGAEFDLADLRPGGALGASTVGQEYHRYSPIQGGGLAIGNSRLSQLLGHDLLDNHNQALRRLSIDEAGHLLIFSFTKTDASRGYWRRDAAGDQYNVFGVRFDIRRSRWQPDG